MRIKTEIQNKFYFWVKGLKSKKNWTKRSKNNQKNEDQVWYIKIKTIFNLMMKL
jgi:hypothetical protein